MQTREASLKEQLARAEALQRNVPFTMYWAADDKREDDLKLSLRENLGILAGYCGLTLWHRLSIVGAKRDALRSAGMPHTHEDVLHTLKDALPIWSSGPKITGCVVRKWLTLWNKFGEVREIERAVLLSQAFWGRKHLFEQRKKVDCIASAGLAEQDVVWVMESFIATRLYNGAANFRVQEMMLKTGHQRVCSSPCSGVRAH